MEVLIVAAVIAVFVGIVSFGANTDKLYVDEPDLHIAL